MNDSILPSVCCAKKKGPAGILSARIYRYDFESAKSATSINSKSPVISQVDSNFDTPSLKVRLRYELTQEDFDKLTYIKQKLHTQLSPVLEEHGLKFKYNKGGGPEEEPKNPDGTLFWTIIIKNKVKKLKRDDPEFFWLFIQATVGELFDMQSGKKLRARNPCVSFIIRFRQISHDYLDIPTQGIGSGFYIEELITRLEPTPPNLNKLDDWRTRLDWHCEMICKHHQAILSEIPRKTIEEIFDGIRNRAVCRDV